MDPIDKLALQEDNDYYGFDYPPKPLNLEFVEIEGTGLIEIQNPTNCVLNWWE